MLISVIGDIFGVLIYNRLLYYKVKKENHPAKAKWFTFM